MLHSVPLRLTRSVFGLFTIWCLGCASFDSLIQQLVSGGASQSGSCMTTNESPRQPLTGSAVVADATADQRAIDGCGCTQCVGVETAVPSLAPTPQPTPDTFAEVLGAPLSDNSEPLVPPPQALSIG
jgi:hypothetical protein